MIGSLESCDWVAGHGVISDMRRHDLGVVWQSSWQKNAVEASEVEDPCVKVCTGGGTWFGDVPVAS